MIYKKDEEVCFLYFNKLCTGRIKREKGKVKNRYYYIIADNESEKLLNVAEEYIKPINAKFTLVESDCQILYHEHEDTNIRFDVSTYKTRNKTYEYWLNPQSWIQEKYDYTCNRIRSYVYGLEI